MPRLQIESGTNVIRLDDQERTGKGFQVHTGVLGLGLPAVNVQWLEGAGDGATYRGSRTLPRDIDLPISVLAERRSELRERMSELALALSRECTLRLVEDDGASWFAKVHRVGGGEYTYGVDTDGEREAQLVLTVRAGDPYWTSETPLQTTIQRGSPRGLLPNLVNLQLASTQTVGTITLDNPGDADAYPTWRVRGPGRVFRAESPQGEVLQWDGELLAGEFITIDTRRGTVVDHLGHNRYDQLAPAPRMWRVRPGTSTSIASIEGAEDDTQIVCTWRPRRWLVI